MQSTENPFKYEDGEASADFNPETGEMDSRYPQTRWIKAMQLDFAARADWCVLSYDEANHPPAISILEGNKFDVSAGEKVSLFPTTKDPDGHHTDLKVWPYAEAGDGTAIIETNPTISVQIPDSANSGEEYHVIFECTDTGFPALTRYQRVVFVVR